LGEYQKVMANIPEAIERTMKAHDDSRYTKRNVLFLYYKYAFTSATPIAPKGLEHGTISHNVTPGKLRSANARNSLTSTF